jgi:hypothetical protein
MRRARLFAALPDRIFAGMRAVLLVLALPLLAAAPAPEQPLKPAGTAPPAKPEGPKLIGRFDDWTAATNSEAGERVCYAFVRAGHSAPAIPGRGDVVLTVTQRPSGRDAVAISAGFPYATNAAVAVQVDQTALDFYAAGRSAFARDGHAAAAAFGRGKQVTAHSPGPRKTAVVDTFSLKGFARAYEAINKACPPK